MIPAKLNFGDEIRIIAPSDSLRSFDKRIADRANYYLCKKGFTVSISQNCEEIDEIDSSSIASRISDLHDAFSDKNVKAILACRGGYNVNQILEYIDYSLIEKNPKLLCGSSDITALLNAVYCMTGLITYHSPNYKAFACDDINYTYQYFEKCLIGEKAYFVSPSNNSKKYYSIIPGVAEGQIIGGNLCTLNLLQGTSFMPSLKEKILFLEDDNIMGDYFVHEFDRNLQSLSQTKEFAGVKGIVFGCFDESCKLNLQTIERIVKNNRNLRDIPVVFNVDFGHVRPHNVTFPIGGTVRLESRENSVMIEILKH